MRYIKVIAGAAVIWVIVIGIQFIIKEGNSNSVKLNNDWGIAKDKPIR